MIKNNPWVWTAKTESIKPDRKAGATVPIGYLSEGASEWHPYQAWIQKGYVERKEELSNILEDFEPEDGVLVIPPNRNLTQYDFEKLFAYCQEKGIKASELTVREKKMFAISKGVN